MIRRLILSGVILGVCAFLGSASVRAAEGEAENFTRSGPYVQAGAAFGFDNFGDALLANPLGRTLDFSFGGGFDGAVGWRILPILGLEIEAVYIGGMEDRLTVVDPSTQEDVSLLVRAQSVFYTLNGKFYPAPLWKASHWNFQPYVKFGLGGLWYDTQGFSQGPAGSISENGMSLRAGAGVDMHVNEHYFAYVDATYGAGVTSTVLDFAVLTVGGGFGYRW